MLSCNIVFKLLFVFPSMVFTVTAMATTVDENTASFIADILGTRPYTGTVRLGAEVSCPYILFSACPKIKWFARTLRVFLPENCHFEKF